METRVCAHLHIHAPASTQQPEAPQAWQKIKTAKDSQTFLHGVQSDPGIEERSGKGGGVWDGRGCWSYRGWSSQDENGNKACGPRGTGLELSLVL